MSVMFSFKVNKMERQMKKLFLALILTFVNLVQADFFTFRKLINPLTGKTVYLLYDIHALIKVNPF